MKTETINLKSMMTAIVFGLTLGPALANAENTQEVTDPIESRGVITAINAEKHKITLDHEPIPELNWPRMIMGFSVAPEVDLDGLSKSDQVVFTLTPAGKGQQVTSISKTDPAHD